MAKKFLEFVAEVMEVEVSEISMETRYKEFGRWDSLMMMNLVMELEEEYDTSISLDSVGKVATLKDLFEIIEIK